MNICEKIQFELSLLDQDQALSGSLERHLKDCVQCRQFSLSLEKQNQELSDLRRPTPADWAWLVRNAQSRTTETATLVSTVPNFHPMARKERTFGKIAITVALAAGLLVTAASLLPWLPIAGRWNQPQVGVLPGGVQDQTQAKLPASKMSEKAAAGEAVRKQEGPTLAEPESESSQAQMDFENRKRKSIAPSASKPAARGEAQDKTESFMKSALSQNKAENGPNQPAPAPAPGPAGGPGPVAAPGPATAPGLSASSGSGAATTPLPGGRPLGMAGADALGERKQQNEGTEDSPSALMRNGALNANRGGGMPGGGGFGGGGGFNGAQNNLQNNLQNNFQNNLPYAPFGQADGQGFQVTNAPQTDQADARSIIRGMVPTPEQKVRFTLLLCQQSAADVKYQAQTELEMANVAREQNALKKVAKTDASSAPDKNSAPEKNSLIDKNSLTDKSSPPNSSQPSKEELPFGRGTGRMPAENRSIGAAQATGAAQDKNKIEEQKKALEQQPAYMVQNNRNFYLAMVPAKNTDDIVKSYDDIVKKDIPALLSGLRSPSNKKDLESLLRFLKDSEKEFSQLAANIPQQGQWLNRVIELNKKGIALIQGHNP